MPWIYDQFTTTVISGIMLYHLYDLLLHYRGYVAIGIHGLLEGAMPQPILYNLIVHAGFNQHGCVSMPQTMKGERRESHTVKRLPCQLFDGVTAQGLTIRSAEQQSHILKVLILHFKL